MSCFKFFLLILIFSGNALAKDCADNSYFLQAQKFYKSGQYLLGAVHFSHIALTGCTPQLKERSQIYYAQSMMNLGENTEALRTLDTLSKSPDPNIKKSALLGLGLLGVNNSEDPDVQTRFKIWNNRFDSETLKATEELEKNSKNYVDLSKLHKELLNSPKKSPLVAGISSGLLPGAGQAYVGAYQSAAVSFILNALLISATVEFYDEDLKSAALTSGAIWSVVYLGNIINAVDSAKKYNSSRYQEAEQNLKNSLFPEISL